MSSGKSTRFFYIFILTLVVGGVFLFLSQLGLFKHCGFNLISKPLLTVEEMSRLIQGDINQRAELLIVEKAFEESENDSLLFYSFPQEKGWLVFQKIPFEGSQIDIYIKNKKDYLDIKDQFKQLEEDTLGIYKLSNKYLFDMGYSRPYKSYWILLLH